MAVASVFLVPEGDAGSYVFILWGAQLLLAFVGWLALLMPSAGRWFKSRRDGPQGFTPARHGAASVARRWKLPPSRGLPVQMQPGSLSQDAFTAAHHHAAGVQSRPVRQRILGHQPPPVKDPVGLGADLFRGCLRLQAQPQRGLPRPRRR